MGLFSGLTKFADDVLGIDPGGGGIVGPLAGAGTAALALGTGPVGIGIGALAGGAFGGDILGGVEDAFKDITGQTAADELKRLSGEQAKGLERFIGLIEPTIQAGQRQIEPLERAATPAGFGAGIGEILGGGALDPLIAERQRAAESTLAARGLRRSGAAVQAASDIPADLAFQIESELNRRRQSIAQQGQTGIGQAGGIQSQIGSILAGGGQQALQARTAGTQNIIGLGGALLSAFSDSRLKENIKNVGELGGLNVVSWTWNKAANDIGLAGESVGFIAQDVQKLYPQHTSSRDGLLTIDYDGLLQEVKHG